MAKRKSKAKAKTETQALPSTEPVVEQIEANNPPVVKPIENVEAAVAAVLPKLKDDCIETVEVKIPVTRVLEGYTGTNRFDLRLKGHQSQSLTDITNGLIERKAKLADGHFVRLRADAIKWLLEATAR